jgi:tRNA/rRNA methyltransferase
MANFGLNDLVLVDPIANRQSLDAVMMATRGLDILNNARIVNTIPEALADCTMVISTSGETGGLMRKGFWGTPAEQLPNLLAALDRGPAAIMFGPEPHGLTLEEIALGQSMMYIPACEEYPSLNLAQAVAVVLYELRKQSLDREPPRVPDEPPATLAEQELMFAKLKESLAAVRFLWDFRSDGIFHVIRTVIARGLPSKKEVQVFHGLAKQLDYIAREYKVPHPRDVPKVGEIQETPPPDPLPEAERGRKQDMP